MKKLLFIVCLTLTGTSFAQKSPNDMINDFFDTYQKDPGNAIVELYKTNIWTERIKDDIDNVANTVNGFNEERMGKYFGFELITTKRFSESFELHSYLVKYDRQPIRFIFKFYRPNKKWVLYAFKLDDVIDDEIEEAAKLYYLDLE